MLDARSEKNLTDVHPDLIKVVRRAAEICPIPFTVTEGKRTLEREKLLIAQGHSALKDPRNCRHVPGKDGFSHAVDLTPVDEHGNPTWEHIPPFLKICDAMKSAATELKIPLRSGRDWRTFKDYPHHELPVSAYP